MTTTGATVFSGLENMPRGLLLWRSILHWIGGVGIIVTAVAVLPQLRVGGMQLFNLESSDRTGKFLPKVSDIAAYIGSAYVALSMLCALLYGMSGMGWFDAINHSMSTLAAGGFSTYDASFAQFNGTPAIYVAIVFMAIGAMPFSLFAILLLKGNAGPLLRDPQPRLFLALVFIISLMIVVYRETHLGLETFPDRWEEATYAVFSVVSVMTGTGFATKPYDTWGDPVIALFLFATFLGGCAGSAAGGIKMFRLEITAKAIRACDDSDSPASACRPRNEVSSSATRGSGACVASDRCRANRSSRSSLRPCKCLAGRLGCRRALAACQEAVPCSTSPSRTCHSTSTIVPALVLWRRHGISGERLRPSRFPANLPIQSSRGPCK
jgi:Trk-type K+ transport system membrane component